MTSSYELGVATTSVAVLLDNPSVFGHLTRPDSLWIEVSMYIWQGHLKLMREPVIKYTTNKYCSVSETESVQSALKMTSEGFTEAYILNDESVLRLLINDIINAKSSDTAIKHVSSNPLTIELELSVRSIEARTFVGESIPIVDP